MEGSVEGWVSGQVTAQCGFPPAISSFAFQWGLSITPHIRSWNGGGEKEGGDPVPCFYSRGLLRLVVGSAAKADGSLLDNSLSSKDRGTAVNVR